MSPAGLVSDASVEGPLDPLPYAHRPHAPVPAAVGVVGVGGRARSHLDTCIALQKAGYYRLLGVCDANAARADEVAAKYGTAPFHRVEALLDALARGHPAIVVVVTPPDIHHPVVELAAERGIHALVETPLSFSLAGADLMTEASRRAGTFLETAENVWRFPEERIKRLIVDRGVIGEVALIQTRYASGSYHGMNATRHLARSPLVRVSGDVAEMATPLQRGAGGGEMRSALWEAGLLRFANGVRGVFQLPVRPTLHNHWEVDGSDGCLEGGDLRIGGRDGERVPIERVTEQRDHGEALAALRYGGPRPVEWENPFRHLPIGSGTDDVARADEHLSLHRAAVGVGAGDYSGEQGRADLAGVLAIHESARRGGEPVDPAVIGDGANERALREAYERKHGFSPEDAKRHLDRVVPTNRPMVRGGT